jgi:hypothetical protein
MALDQDFPNRRRNQLALRELKGLVRMNESKPGDVFRILANVCSESSGSEGLLSQGRMETAAPGIRRKTSEVVKNERKWAGSGHDFWKNRVGTTLGKMRLGTTKSGGFRGMRRSCESHGCQVPPNSHRFVESTRRYIMMDGSAPPAL